jgi:aspartate aminotransferase-like enzyme
VHSETSTGVLNSIQEITAVAREFEDVLVLVDSVTGIAGAEVWTDRWGLDFVLTGSQKALALPPGLAFAVASERMMSRAQTARNKGIYFDLLQFQKSQDQMQTPNTPALSVMYALEKQLERVAEETMEGRWQRHAAMRDATVRWVDEMSANKGVGLSVLAPEGFRSPTVTTVKMPEGRSSVPVVAAMKERGIVIGGGYGKLKEPTFRIGHMGDHTVAELEAVLAALEEVLTS